MMSLQRGGDLLHLLDHPARPLTPAEELAKLRERVLHELGPLGAKLIAGVPL